MNVLKKYAEAAFSGLLALYAAAVFCLAFGISGVQQPGELLTPKLYVQLLSAAFFILSLANAILSLRRQRSAQAADDAPATKESRLGLLKMGLMMALGLLFVVGMKVIGFYLAAFLTVLCGYLIIEGLGKKNVITAIIFAAAICTVFYFVFQKFHIYLPNYMLKKLF